MGKKSKRNGKTSQHDSAESLVMKASFEQPDIGTASSFESVSEIPRTMSEEEKRKHVEAIVAQALASRDTSRPSSPGSGEFDPSTFWESSIRSLLAEQLSETQ